MASPESSPRSFAKLRRPRKRPTARTLGYRWFSGGDGLPEDRVDRSKLPKYTDEMQQRARAWIAKRAAEEDEDRLVREYVEVVARAFLHRVREWQHDRAHPERPKRRLYRETIKVCLRRGGSRLAEWTYADDPNDAIELIAACTVTVLDLWDDDWVGGGSALSVLRWIEDATWRRRFVPPTIFIHAKDGDRWLDLESMRQSIVRFARYGHGASLVFQAAADRIPASDGNADEIDTSRG